MVVRLLLWNLADSKTTLDELRARLPELSPGDTWISDEATERFGLISFAQTLPDLTAVRELIGKDPELGETFDVEGA